MLQQEVSFCISPRVWTLGSNRTDISLDSLQEESWTTNRCPKIWIRFKRRAGQPTGVRRSVSSPPTSLPFRKCGNFSTSSCSKNRTRIRSKIQMANSFGCPVHPLSSGHHVGSARYADSTKKVTINEGKSLGFLCHFFGQSTIFPIFRYLF